MSEREPDAGRKLPAKSARHKAMDLLARREYSEQELRQRLNRTGYPDVEIEEALHGLQQDGLQSDSRFAEMFVRHRADKGFGPLKVRAELRNRGVEASLVDHHLHHSGLDWFDSAVRAWRRKYGSRPVADLKDKARRFRYLSGRGFNHEHVAHACRVCEREDQ